MTYDASSASASKQNSSVTSKQKPQTAASNRPSTYGRVDLDEIARATLELLRLHSREDVSVTMIAAQAGTKRSSIYRHFKGVEDIYRHLSRLYLSEIRPFVEDYVKNKCPASLEDVIVYMIDAAVEFFDHPHHLDRTLAIQLQLNAAAFVIGYHDEIVDLLDVLWSSDWQVGKDSETHPFRVLAMIITAIFEVSLRTHGRITEAFAQETRSAALSYIRSASQRIGNEEAHADDIDPLDRRIAAALRAIRSATDPVVVETGVEMIERIAILSSNERR